MIKLEFGKKYRNRQGDVVIVMSLDELNKRRKEAGKSQLAPSASESDYFGVFPGLSFTAHRKDGINFYGNTNYDLVEEIPGLNFEIGKYYKTANCVKVKILETDIPNDKDMMYVMFMSTGSTAKYNKNGEYVSNKNYNIIGEWKEVKKVKGWIAVIHDRYTGKTFAGDIIYDTKELALAAPNAVGASEIEVEYEVK